MKAAVGGALVLALSFVASGCGLFHRQPPQPPMVLIPQPPILLPAAPLGEPPMPPPAVMNPTTASTLPPITPVQVGAPPPPPRRTPENSSSHWGRHLPAADKAPQPDAAPPQLTTNLSPAQQSEYRRNTLALLNRTQSELRTLYGRPNFDAQAAATRAQAGEYVRQARVALLQGDLVRAQTLAEKAQTLANFLLDR